MELCYVFAPQPCAYTVYSPCHLPYYKFSLTIYARNLSIPSFEIN